jgi:hypothetical protein
MPRVIRAVIWAPRAARSENRLYVTDAPSVEGIAKHLGVAKDSVYGMDRHP